MYMYTYAISCSSCRQDPPELIFADLYAHTHTQGELVEDLELKSKGKYLSLWTASQHENIIAK